MYTEMFWRLIAIRYKCKLTNKHLLFTIIFEFYFHL